MKMKLYVVRDVVSGHAPLHLTAENDACLKRNVSTFLAAKQPNPINTDIEDKQIYCVGEYDDETMIITVSSPIMVFTVSQIEEELIAKIKAKQALVGVQDGGSEEASE